MFKGEHFHTLDSKGRLIMPSKFRQNLGDQFVATKGLDRCLFVYPVTEWNALEANLKQLPFTKSDYRAFTRLFFSGAEDCEFDRQGRFLIPQGLRDYAGIDRDVVAIGVTNRIEIWAKAEWEQYQKKHYQSYEALAEKIVDVGNEA